jgi:hypothetical protein
MVRGGKPTLRVATTKTMIARTEQRLGLNAASAGFQKDLNPMSLVGASRHLVRCSDMSGVEVKAVSKSMASFGRF